MNILSIFAILAITFPATGSAFAEGEQPNLRAFPDQDRVDGSFWPANQQVFLVINDDPFAPQTADGDGHVEFALTDYDLERGDTLTMSSGDIYVTYTARQLFVDNIDPDTETVSGTVDGQQTVHVWTGGVELYVEDTDSEGNWSAGFSSFGDVIFPGACGNAEAWGENNANSTIIDWCVPRPFWRDEFNGPLAVPWYWINENADKSGFNDGFLRIYASPYGTGSENLLLRPVAAGDFMIKTRVLFEPDTNFQFAGLVIWQDENNFLQLGRAFCSYEDAPCVGNGIYFDHVGGGTSVDGNFATSIGNPSDVFLRLERRGDMVRAFYSADEGISWYEIGTHWIPPDFQVNGVGLTASQDGNTPDWDIPADFDFFELTEGWGFLPEGFHDYDSGDVPSWACNVGGWAADPDDREADVNIEIVVDDQTAANLVAGEFRQDLLDAGVCVDGNCSFSTSLWGVISSYEPHRVDVWAQDTTRGDWVLLSNSAKTLTCRTYDIYDYDPLTGTTKRITNLLDADEYNPSFSPNGKKVAHDAVFADSSLDGIYITDVKTGVSTPLLGAGPGSNDAVWSPNGKWIVFDRAWDEEPSLYLVPSEGGVPTHVRSNAISADWAPNGKRLVFQQPSDGSIMTVPVDGGGGSETFIAASGANPVWSPDGNWIAYENEGDIWKVQVNVQGTVFGEPIQVTSGPFNDGLPTWSADSLTIVYHSGFNSDWDLWSVPAAGGMPTWLNGAPEFGDYDPAYAKNSSNVAYASFSPDGQAARQWIAAYTYDYGTWSEGDHSYHFETTWNGGSETTPEIFFSVSNESPTYAGYVLLRPFAVRAYVDGACPAIDNPVLLPDQLTRFHVGYVTDYPMTYAESLAYFGSLVAKVSWDDGMSADLVRHEIFPLTSQVDWGAYLCTYTSP